MARDAGAQRLVLTHYGAERNAADIQSDARAAYSGEIVVADDNARFIP